MRIRLLATLILLSVAFPLAVRAETVFVKGRDKFDKAIIKSEDAKNVVLTLGKKTETIPAVDVIDIVYDDSISPLDLKGGAYKVAKDAEKDSNSEDTEKRNKSLALAVINYNKTLKEMKRDTKEQKNAARHLEFKIAVLGLRQGADQTTRDLGVERLQAFAKAHRDSWQINQVFPMIAQLQLDNRDFKEAAKTFQEMADMEVFSTEVRRDAKLMVVTVAVRSGKSEDIEFANKRLDALEAEAKANPAFAARVRMARAEVYIGQKQIDKAMPLLHEVIKTSTDKQALAIAHNTIGESLFKAGKYSEARWEFLWVDTIYNQDKGQHARALYFLWKTFDQLNERDRAQQCRDALIEDRQFAGTEHQKLAIAQAK
jgi:tetratricopeptide (TPR) repeat protein